MAIIYNKYIDLIDYVWFDSTNVLYCECYDTNEQYKNLKLVFKGGRTYLYKDVDVKDYISFKMASSNGKSLNEFIKKYQSVRLPDIDLEELNQKKEKFMKLDDTIEKIVEKPKYKLVLNEDNSFILYENDIQIFHGIENEVSIMKLFKCMNIPYQFGENE